jgi:hypothetical protein
MQLLCSGDRSLLLDSDLYTVLAPQQCTLRVHMYLPVATVADVMFLMQSNEVHPLRIELMVVHHHNKAHTARYKCTQVLPIHSH